MNILETAGHGGGLFDYDNDGWLDIVLLAVDRCALFRARGDGSFEEVTVRSGLRQQGYWMGCAAADFNNDGWQDLFVSGYQCVALYRNDRGLFREVSAKLPLAVRKWSTSAVFFDVDRDGWLDLYVGCYVQFGPKDLQLCDFSGVKAACPPTYYEPERGHLFRNLGGERGFADVTTAWSLSHTHGKTLGVAAADYDGDGRCDLYLANDGVPGDLFRNLGHRFVNVGVTSGTALNVAGREQAGMGADWGDYNNDGRLDLIVTTFQFEPTSLYRSVGGGRFLEDAGAAGLADTTINHLGFGARFFDADNDGDLDLLIANGHVQNNVAELNPSVHYEQPVQLFENRDDRFIEVTIAVGPALSRPMVGRAVAIADIDNNGTLDALVTNLEGAPRLLKNQSRTTHRWLRLRLIGKHSPRDGTGAVVTVRVRKRIQIRVAGTGSGYLCSSEPVVHFGVGAAQIVDELVIRWPGGTRQTLRDVATNRTLELAEQTMDKLDN